MEDLLKIELKIEKDIELLRKAAIKWQEMYLYLSLELKKCQGDADIEKLKEIWLKQSLS